MSEAKPEVTPKGNNIPQQEWADMLGPLIAKFKVGHTFGKGVTFNGAGCDALAKMLASMGRRLDYHLTLQGGKDIQHMTDDEFAAYVKRADATRRRLTTER